MKHWPIIINKDEEGLSVPVLLIVDGDLIEIRSLHPLYLSLFSFVSRATLSRRTHILPCSIRVGLYRDRSTLSLSQRVAYN